MSDKVLWLLFRAMVCSVIEQHGAQDAIDCDPWEFSGCLDMSFDEIKSKPVGQWQAQIEDDLHDYLDSTKS